MKRLPPLLGLSLPPLLGLSLTFLLLSSALHAPGAPRGRPDWAPADTDTVQQKIAVVGGDSLSGYTEGGATVQLFIGNVSGVQDSTELFANWAKRNVDAASLLLVGDVVLVDQGDTLRADTVHYSESQKEGQAAGHVQLTDGEVVAHAPEGTYFVDDKRAVFARGVKLIDSTSTVTGRWGEYWTGEKRAELGGQVRLVGEEAVVESDSLTHLRSEEIALARGNVAIERSAQEDGTEISTFLFGDWAHMDEGAGRSRLRGRPHMIQLRRDTSGVDTLAMQADALMALDTDTMRELAASGQVRFWSADLQAMADSLAYEEREAADSASASGDSTMHTLATIRLFGSPLVWVEGAQISGDSMRAVLLDDEVDSLFVWGDAFVAQEDTVLGRTNQARGRSLVAWFEAEDRRTFRVGPNAEIVYFRRDEEDAPDGALQVSGDEAVLEMVGDESQQLFFVGEYQGTYFPESVLEMPLELSGFRWEPARRPTLREFTADPRYSAWLQRKMGS